jgi:hypothetical protein
VVTTTTELLTLLRASASPVGSIRAPESPGVYAWFLDDPAVLPTISIAPQQPAYVGITSSLRERGDDTHFSDTGTGFSTLRRSLGALLKDELDLVARPRGTGASKQNYTCYRFDSGGEQRLTGWMRAHLRVATAEHVDPGAVETDLIAHACPPLNLNGWPNPYRAEIMALRKICVGEAEQHRR